MHTCGDISISEILYHYHDMENYITMIDISIILHITKIMYHNLLMTLFLLCTTCRKTKHTLPTIAITATVVQLLYLVLTGVMRYYCTRRISTMKQKLVMYV